MVLESLFSAKKIESKPIDMLILSVIITFVSILISAVIFPDYAGVIFPLLITICMTPLMLNIFKYEEEIEREQAEGKIKETFLERHGETIYLFSLFFVGVFISTFLFSLVLHEKEVTSLFRPQLNSITTTRSISGAMFVQDLLGAIIANNLKVMFFSFVLSFIFGAGALFILSWNASILAVFLADFIKKGAITHFLSAGIQILPHTPVEILAYFLAGIGGGMLSAGIIREKVKSKEFSLIFRDSFFFLIFAVISVLLGAFLEIYL